MYFTKTSILHLTIITFIFTPSVYCNDLLPFDTFLSTKNWNEYHIISNNKQTTQNAYNIDDQYHGKTLIETHNYPIEYDNNYNNEQKYKTRRRLKRRGGRRRSRRKRRPRKRRKRKRRKRKPRKKRRKKKRRRKKKKKRGGRKKKKKRGGRKKKKGKGRKNKRKSKKPKKSGGGGGGGVMDKLKGFVDQQGGIGGLLEKGQDLAGNIQQGIGAAQGVLAATGLDKHMPKGLTNAMNKVSDVAGQAGNAMGTVNDLQGAVQNGDIGGALQHAQSFGQQVGAPAGLTNALGTAQNLHGTAQNVQGAIQNGNIGGALQHAQSFGQQVGAPAGLTNALQSFGQQVGAPAGLTNALGHAQRNSAKFTWCSTKCTRCKCIWTSSKCCWTSYTKW
eukprot:90331_1